jgi:neutral amino acid transport system permease protein
VSESDPAAMGAASILDAPATEATRDDLAQPGRARGFLLDSRVVGLLAVTAVVVLLLLTRGVHDVAQATVAGLVTGAYFALGATGLSIVYGTLRLPNFAHGDLLTFGVYIAFWASTAGLPFLVAAAAGLAITAVLTVATELVLWRPMRARRASLFQLILITIGLSFLIRNSIQFIWGGQPQSLPVDVIQSVTFLGLYIGRTELIATIVGFTAIVLVALMLRFTSLGKQMRALADNQDLAEATGIDTDRIIIITWIFAGILAALAGILYGASIGQLTPTIGSLLLLSLFGAAVLGGIGNAYGALLGGIVLGLGQEWAVLYVDPRWKIAVGFVVLIVTLIVRPQGIFGAERGI